MKLTEIPEITDYETYVGTASPFNFNGLVRHYYMRRGENVADIQVNLTPKGDRQTRAMRLRAACGDLLSPSPNAWYPNEGRRGAARSSGAANARC